MRLPRDSSGNELASLLARLGCRASRQSGSHLRLTTQERGEHHVTIRNHDPLRVGTLSSILGVVAARHGIDRDDLLRRLLGSTSAKPLGPLFDLVLIGRVCPSVPSASS